MKRKLFCILILSSIFYSLSFAQGVVNNDYSLIKYNGENNYILTERTDLRLYKNGKYVGLESREVSSFIIPTFKDNKRIYEGYFYLNKDTKHNNQSVKAGIRKAITSCFTIDNEGNLTMIEDNGYPSFRSFPSFTTQKIKIGDSWTASATRVIDPLDKGVITKLPLQIQYTYVGDEVYNGQEVYLITAKWATRYGIIGSVSIMDWGGDYELERATGAHSATIYVSKSNGTALVIRDSVDETFFYTDGNYYQYKGTITLFTEYPPAVNHDKIIPALRRIAREVPAKTSDGEIADKDKILIAAGIGSNGAGDDVGATGMNSSAAGTGSTAAGTKSTLAGTGSSAAGTNSTMPGNNSTVTGNNFSVAGTNSASTGTGSSAARTNSTTANTNSTTARTGSTTANTNSTTARNTSSSIATQSTAQTNPSVALANTLQSEDEVAYDNIKYETTESGIKLIIEDLRFEADSAKLLEGENQRLKDIAQVLKQAENSKFLIEGHTASTGNPNGEMKLSYERAESIANKLISLGLNADQFICKGSGGLKPVAPNDTPEGRARNRRVEITILE